MKKKEKKNEGKDVIIESNEEVLGEQKTNVEEDIEEGEMVESWSDVTPEKASKSSSSLKFSQEKLLTPSRFSALLEVDENGDKIKPIEMEKVLSIEECNGGKNVTEEVGIEEQTGGMNGNKEVREENQKRDIAGLDSKEHWPDLASATKIRPSLPRRSKTLHKVIPEKPGQLGKRNPTNLSQ